jgi:hypothetical protein
MPYYNTIATDIIDGTTALAWSIDHGLLFSNGGFYIPATSPLLVDLPDAPLFGGQANMRPRHLVYILRQQH